MAFDHVPDDKDLVILEILQSDGRIALSVRTTFTRRAFIRQSKLGANTAERFIDRRHATGFCIGDAARQGGIQCLQLGLAVPFFEEPIPEQVADILAA